MTLIGLLKGKVTFESLHDWMELNRSNKYFTKLFKTNKLCISSESTLHHLLINVDNNQITRVRQ